MIREGDVYGFWRPAGAASAIHWTGYPPHRADIAAGTVSRGEAERLYGVVIDDAGNVDDSGTAARRRDPQGAQRLGGNQSNANRRTAPPAAAPKALVSLGGRSGMPVR